jgi:dipeptidyl-peptidase-4
MRRLFFTVLTVITAFGLQAQDASLLTIDRVFNSNEFSQERAPKIRWVDEGEGYITQERSLEIEGGKDLVRYNTQEQRSRLFLSAKKLIPEGAEKPLRISDFVISLDQSKVLIFTNTKRVWRSNTKGDYYFFNKNNGTLRQLGQKFGKSALMFAKFSPDALSVAYIHGFNLYVENLESGVITQLTKDGTDDIINGTFDWVYEEEFGCRDGFRWNEAGSHIAFWQLDASDIKDFLMINNTDDVYSKTIPVQYPKVGEKPSSAKVGIITVQNQKTKWIELPNGGREHYIPRMQWVDASTLLIQQLNRKQNILNIYTYNVQTGKLKKIYTEESRTWVDISYPDATANGWDMADLTLVDENKAFLRMVETEDYRRVFKIYIKTGNKRLITRNKFDVASVYGQNRKTGKLYFSASPFTTTHRYMYEVDLSGKRKAKQITPANWSGMNFYNVSPNGRYAVHSHQNHKKTTSVRLITLPDHQEIISFVKNDDYIAAVNELKMPETEFFRVKTVDGIEIEGKMLKPYNFDKNKKYPVLFYVYGEPWGAVANDTWNSLWNVMLTQKGYIVIAMDNRGTPCLKGTAWRKSIYRKIGIVNSRDQAMAAKEILKKPYLDNERVAVWGWSGGGSMTLNLMFRYPEIYKTGMAVAAVANQLYYDNAYQERYMGIPEETKQDFIDGSPLSQAKNLKGNLLVIHGTADDNVHYQNAETLINELIKENKQFDLMIYPNRSHGIYEGKNTTRHLYTLLTNYLLEHVPVTE